jgi:Holliday junction resolvasome RuvABC DNA-binding subunit
LKGKLTQSVDVSVSGNFDELVSVLESLGYKNVEIKKILPKVNASLDIESQVKEALKLMLK